MSKAIFGIDELKKLTHDQLADLADWVMLAAKAISEEMNEGRYNKAIAEAFPEGTVKTEADIYEVFKAGTTLVLNNIMKAFCIGLGASEDVSLNEGVAFMCQLSKKLNAETKNDVL